VAPFNSAQRTLVPLELVEQWRFSQVQVPLAPVELLRSAVAQLLAAPAVPLVLVPAPVTLVLEVAFHWSEEPRPLLQQVVPLL
jgi:hypothetical protein